MSPMRHSNISNKWPRNQKYPLDLEPIKYKTQHRDTYDLMYFIIKLCMHCKKYFVKSALLWDTVEESHAFLYKYLVCIVLSFTFLHSLALQYFQYHISFGVQCGIWDFFQSWSSIPCCLVRGKILASTVGGKDIHWISLTPCMWSAG